MLNVLKRWIAPELFTYEQENKDLHAKLEKIAAELEMFKKVKVVADLRMNKVIQTQNEQDRLQSLWITTAKTIDHIRNSMADTANTAKEQRQHLCESTVNYQQIKTILQAISSSFGSMEHKTTAATTGVSELIDAAQQIESFLSDIKSIADQTNLLALNAAIEAARAGEQGRGFAVVADEVRALAQKTSNSSTEISELVQTIADKINNVAECINQTNETAHDTSQSTSNISNLVDEFTGSAQKMASSISISSEVAFIQTVKLDHVVWKTEVYQRIWKKSEKAIESFSDHTQCRLGLWYYKGEGAHDFSTLSAFKAIESPHKAVHQNGIAALKFMEENRFEEAFGALENMEAESSKILDLLTRLETQIVDFRSHESADDFSEAPDNTEFF